MQAATGEQVLDASYKHFDHALNMVAPVITMRVNNPNHAPWISQELRTAQRELHTIYRRYRRNKRPNELKAYRIARDALRAKLHTARAIFYRVRLQGVSLLHVAGASQAGANKICLLFPAGGHSRRAQQGLHTCLIHDILIIRDYCQLVYPTIRWPQTQLPARHACLGRESHQRV